MRPSTIAYERRSEEEAGTLTILIRRNDLGNLVHMLADDAHAVTADKRGSCALVVTCAFSLSHNNDGTKRNADGVGQACACITVACLPGS